VALSHITDITQDSSGGDGVLSRLLSREEAVPALDRCRCERGERAMCGPNECLQVLSASGDDAWWMIGPKTYGGQTVTRSYLPRQLDVCFSAGVSPRRVSLLHMLPCGPFRKSLARSVPVHPPRFDALLVDLRDGLLVPVLFSKSRRARLLHLDDACCFERSPTLDLRMTHEA
jgi:hypothetical protein